MSAVITLSLDSAVAVSGVSRSTLRRRMADGSVREGEKDASGRTTLVLSDVLALAHLPLDQDDLRVLLQADAGDAVAQTDMGAFFYLAGRDDAAQYWLHKAAAQGNTESMHWLGMLCAAGRDRDLSAERSRDAAVMWVARAAALGHPIAQRQMEQLLRGVEFDEPVR